MGSLMRDHRNPSVEHCVACATEIPRGRDPDDCCSDRCKKHWEWRLAEPKQPVGPDPKLLRFRPREVFHRERPYIPEIQPGVGYVYFIQSGEGGAVKIGKANNPHMRLGHLQVGNPTELRFLAVTRGGEKLERLLHHVLYDDRIRGEWFAPSDRVLACASAAREGSLLNALAAMGVTRRDLFIANVKVAA